ncbi:MAG TPA: HEAT repeat domain-containing protein, partial [Candidatus Elarobacter sp.]|nr:HEAT repeat domain-containing protein [Candidatus Elarobacter sp.]
MLIAALAGALLAAPIRTPPQRARSDDVVRLYARVLHAADARTPDSAAFADALQSSDPRLRRAAARAIAQLAPSHRADVLPQLRALSDDRDANVAASAMFGLGLGHDTVSLGRMAALARSGSTAAAWSLGELGAPARDTLSSLLEASARASTRASANSSATVALLLAASKMKPVDVAHILPMLRARDARVRWAAAYAIARQRSPAGARALLELRSTDPAILAEVARELTAPIAGDSLRAAAFARLRQLAGAPSPYVRINALRSLGTYGADGRDALVAALRDRDVLVRVAAAQSVASAFARDSAAWRAAWSSDTTYEVRRALLESAATARFESPGDSAWRASNEWRLRAAAVRAWGNSRDSTRARSVALAAIRDPDGRVRAAAYALVAGPQRGVRDSIVDAILRAGASDPDSLAREEARDPGAPRLSRAPADPHPIEWYDNLVRTLVTPAQRGRAPRAVISTARGPITIALFAAETPLTVENFT